MINRRELLLALSAAGLLGPQAGRRLEPAALAVDAGEVVYVGRDLVRIKVSPPAQGRLAMITQDVTPGTSIPVHLHEREDEIIFIQSGRGEAVLGEATVNLSAGSTLFVPQGTMPWVPFWR